MVEKRGYGDAQTLLQPQDFFPIGSVTKSSTAKSWHENLVEKFKIFVQDFVTIKTGVRNVFCWAVAKNRSSRCFLAKNGCTLKTVAAESVVGRIWLVNTHYLPFLAKSDRVLPVIATLLSFHPFMAILCFFPVGYSRARTDQHGPQE